MKHGIIEDQAYSTMACIYPNNKYVTFNKARHSGGYGWIFLIILNHRWKRSYPCIPYFVSFLWLY